MEISDEVEVVVEELRTEISFISTIESYLSKDSELYKLIQQRRKERKNIVFLGQGNFKLKEGVQS